MLNDLMILLLMLTDRAMILDAISRFDDDTLFAISMHASLSDSLSDIIGCEINHREVRKLSRELSLSREELYAAHESLARKGYEITSLNARIRELEQAARRSSDPEFYRPTDSECLIACNEGKIPAIRAYRARTGSGLLEAKRAIEDAMGKRG